MLSIYTRNPAVIAATWSTMWELGGLTPDGESRVMLGLGAWWEPIASRVGAGIFVLIGHASALAGPAIVLAFVLNAGFAITVGACYAELAVAFPRTGGAIGTCRSWTGSMPLSPLVTWRS